MRVAAILLVLFLLSVGPAAALVQPAAPRALPPEAYPLLPAEIKDADVLVLLAASMGWPVERVPVPTPGPGLDVPTMVQRLGQRAGASVAPEDARAFAELDPALAAPVLTLLVAVDEAWTMRDAAFSAYSEEEMRAMTDALLRGDFEAASAIGPNFGSAEIALLVSAAIMLSDTIESVVIPQLESAAQLGVWPAMAVADPVGVLRIGGTGDDRETLDRIVQIDARGNDEYYNNAGATTHLTDTRPDTLDTPVAVSIDLSGDDRYVMTKQLPAQGAALLGVALLFEVAGDDGYKCARDCTGSAVRGVGVLRDRAGNDSYDMGSRAAGSGDIGLGYLRDDEGGDTYAVVATSGGFSAEHALGLLWDRAGVDSYVTKLSNLAVFGYGQRGGRGWLVDEGPALDSFLDRESGQLSHMCNNCVWSAGAPTKSGRGNDNAGGLGFLIGYQAPWV